MFGTKAVKAGDYVLVLGTGGVATSVCFSRQLLPCILIDGLSFGLQIGVAAEAIVITTSSSDQKLEVAKKLGARHVINYLKTPNWDEEVMKIVPYAPVSIHAEDANLSFPQTDGVGVDHVIDVRPHLCSVLSQR